MHILLIILFTLAPLSIGYASGHMKYNNTENHWAKAAFQACYFSLIALSIYIQLDWLVVLGAFLMWKPCRDIGYTYGDENLRNSYFIYVGETSWDDRFIRLIGLWWIQTNTKFPIVTILYLIMFMFGIGFTIYNHV